MPTAYNSATTLDRPYSPGEFARYAETTGPNVIDEAHYMAPETPEANFSSHPVLQVEAERLAANDLAMPADAYTHDSSQFRVPQSPEVSNYESHIAAEQAVLAGGVENMLSSGDAELNAAQIDARFDEIAARESRPGHYDAMAPRPEAQYGPDGAVLEAYRAGCAAMAMRRLYLQGQERN